MLPAIMTLRKEFSSCSGPSDASKKVDTTQRRFPLNSLLSRSSVTSSPNTHWHMGPPHHHHQQSTWLSAWNTDHQLTIKKMRRAVLPGAGASLPCLAIQTHSQAGLRAHRINTGISLFPLTACTSWRKSSLPNLPRAVPGSNVPSRTTESFSKFAGISFN